MLEFFRLGGAGMWVVLAWGLLLVAGAVRFALSPERRRLPALAALGIVTLLAGGLGFATGAIRSLLALERVADQQRYVAAIGIGESLCNVALALALTMLAAAAIAFGLWRGERAQARAESTVARAA